jgi:hypothetical protein
VEVPERSGGAEQLLRFGVPAVVEKYAGEADLDDAIVG